MGQKTNPIGFRLGIVKPWFSSWFSEANYASQLHEDLKVRKFLKKRVGHAGVSKVVIERRAKQIKINIFTSRPGIIIGKKGSEVDSLKRQLQVLLGSTQEVSINIKEVRRPEIDAQLVAENIALQLERRVAFRRAMKKSVGTTMRFGAKGIRVNCAGRLGGAEIARTEWYREGRVPLHTLRADIDYGVAEAATTFGIIGIKVWIFHGEIIKHRQENVQENEASKAKKPVKRKAKKQAKDA